MRIGLLIFFVSFPLWAWPWSGISVDQFQPRSILKSPSHIPQKPAYPVIEFHGHLFHHDADFSSQMDRTGEKYFVNLAGRTQTPDELKALMQTTGKERVIHFVSFNWNRLKNDDFEGMARDLEMMADLGARGIKLWKNFGLELKDSSGKLLTLDDDRLGPVWDVCARRHLIIAMHTADPPAFFLPVDQYNERYPELQRRPQWSFADSPVSFEDLLAQRERLFRKHKDVTFVALHFGELGHDLQRAGKLLDENSNVYFDTAQRIDELGRQPRATRAFFLKYQNRILYGTDGLPDFAKHQIYWRFFETEDESFDYSPPGKAAKGIWQIHGIHLPSEVLKKLYYQNAERLLEIKVK
jgi:predicted TIM-barrel fold metal-dependent hydrolase